jgi:cytidine deaminase
MIGLVGAIGAPLKEAAETIKRSLDRFDYATTILRLSKFLEDVPESADLDVSSEGKRIKSAMTVGTQLRKRMKRGDALLAYAAAHIVSMRRQSTKASQDDSKVTPSPIANHAFILNSLKHPDEVRCLRQLYRDQFVLIGIYSPRANRLRNLAERLADSAGGRAEQFREEAESLISIDENEQGTKLGQNVRDTFPLADAFIAADRLESDVNRMLDLLFGTPVETPTKDEQGMFFAQAAALRSGALSRQVGACIASTTGDVLAVGCNEVPRAGGGQFWTGDAVDNRDFAQKHDCNDVLKKRVVRGVIKELKSSHWMKDDLKNYDTEVLVKAVMVKGGTTSPDQDSMENGLPQPPRLRDTLIGNLTEFGRDVHAEMAALMTLARLPISGAGCNLYCTTFPCHNCAKHIIAAGIVRVVYIEPYPKSFASEFHSDAIAGEECSADASSGKVVLQPFAGIAPRKYLTWFRAGCRKSDDGQVSRWTPRNALPVFINPEFGGYGQADLDLEANFVAEVLESVDTKSDSIVDANE